MLSSEKHWKTFSRSQVLSEQEPLDTIYARSPAQHKYRSRSNCEYEGDEGPTSGIYLLVASAHHGKRLAIECDGDQYHGPEKWMEDLSRQRVLERAGWRFWRCWGSSFARDKRGCLDDLEKTLKALGIDPIGIEELDFFDLVEFRTVGSEEEAEEYDAGTLETDNREACDDAAPDVDTKTEQSLSPAELIERHSPDDPATGETELEQPAPTSDSLNAHTSPDVVPSPAATRSTRAPGLFDNDVSDLDLFHKAPPPPAKDTTTPRTSGPRISVGDLVRFCFLDEEDEEITACIEDQPSNPDVGIINVETPVAQALLGHRFDDICSVSLPGGDRQARILHIDSLH